MKQKSLLLTFLFAICGFMSCFADVSSVKQAIRNNRNLNIKMFVREVDDNAEFIGDGFFISFTPYGFDYNDNRVISIEKNQSPYFGFSGRSVGKLMESKPLGNMTLKIFWFFFLDTNVGMQPRVAISIGNGDIVPNILFRDSTTKKIFQIHFFEVIDADGEELYSRINLARNTKGNNDFIEILNTVANTLPTVK